MAKKVSVENVRFMPHIKRQWLRLYRASTYCGYDSLFFSMSCRISAYLSANPRLQKQLFPDHLELIKRFLDYVDLKHEASQVLQQHILEKTLLRWHFQDLAKHISATQLEKNFVIEHWHRFEQAYQTGRGVLLVTSHYGLPTVLINYIKMRGYSGLAIGRQRSVRLHAAGEDVSPLGSILLCARDLAEACKALEGGGIAYILPDGASGSTTVSAPLLGRTRHFRTGFAELALTSGAIVLPVTGTPNINGKFYIKFFEPFDSGDSESNRQERIEMLVRQYANHLGQIWSLSPGSMRANDLYRFFDDEEIYQLMEQ